MIFAFFPLFAQDWHWQFSSWNNNDGLESDFITCFEQDDSGQIWVGTENGVFRHDGDKLIPLTDVLPDQNIPPKYFVHDLFIDKHNRLWIGTFQSGLFYFDIEKSRFHKVPSQMVQDIEIPGLRTYGLHEGEKGDVIFSMHQKGIATYFIENDSFYYVKPFTNEEKLKASKSFQLMLSPIKNEMENVQDHWYFTLSSLVKYDPELDTFIYYNPPSIVSLEIRDAIWDKDGTIWLGTYNKGVYSYNPLSKKWLNIRTDTGKDATLNALNVSAIQVWDEKFMIAASVFGGLMLINKKTLKVTHLEKENPYGNWPQSPQNFFRDKMGNLWIATQHGIYLYNKYKQQFNPTFTGGKIIDILKNKNTIIALDLYNRLITLKNQKIISEIEIPKQKDQDSNSSGMQLDSKGQLWVSTQNDLFFMKSEKLYPLFPNHDLYPFGYFRTFVIDSFEHAWLGSQEGTIIEIDLNHIMLTAHTNEANNPNSVLYNYRTEVHTIDSKSNLWFRGDDGIFFYDQKQKQFINSPKNYFSDDGSLISMAESIESSKKEQTIYFASSLNKIYYNKIDSTFSAKPHRILPLSKYPGYAIHDMLLDNKNTLWIATDEGLGKFSPADSSALFFGASEGIQGIFRLNHGADGKILASTHNGYYHFHPDSIINLSLNQNIILNQFKVFDEPFELSNGEKPSIGDTIKLKYNKNFFSFEYNDINYLSKKKRIYQYRLIGLDATWIDGRSRNYSSYTNVRPGNYQFEVRSRSIDNPDWGDPVTLSYIQIQHPFWEKTWFILLASVCLIGLTLLAIRVRNLKRKQNQKLIIEFNKQLAEVEMKALRAQMNPHFLFNVLNAIKLQVQKKEEEKAVKLITNFSKLIRSVLQNSEQKKITLKEELDALELYIQIEQKRFNSEFNYEIITCNETYPSRIMIPPLMLQPYVENAIWHGLMHKSDGKGHIKIEICREHSLTRIIIEDNGIGRNAAAEFKTKSGTQKKSMGLQITKDRMALSDIDISVEIVDLYQNKNPSGTQVIIKLKDLEI